MYMAPGGHALAEGRGLVDDDPSVAGGWGRGGGGALGDGGFVFGYRLKWPVIGSIRLWLAFA